MTIMVDYGFQTEEDYGELRFPDIQTSQDYGALCFPIIARRLATRENAEELYRNVQFAFARIAAAHYVVVEGCGHGHATPSGAPWTEFGMVRAALLAHEHDEHETWHSRPTRHMDSHARSSSRSSHSRECSCQLHCPPPTCSAIRTSS